MTNRHTILILLAFLLLLIDGVILFSLHTSEKRYLTISFLDVGQGDAIFIEAPNRTQILVDGGGDNRILRELDRVMPFADRTIDMVVVTNPDKDHIGGFIDVFNRYTIDHIVEPGTYSESSTYQSLVRESIEEKSSYHQAKAGTKIILDAKRNIYLDILFPDKDVSNWKTNDGSLVMQLVYGESRVLLTGDTIASIETYLTEKNTTVLETDILKVAHHGSRTSTAEAFLKAVNPMIAVISAGKDNSYGHPHSEVTERLTRFQIPYFVTANEGRVTFVTDGRDWKRK